MDDPSSYLHRAQTGDVISEADMRQKCLQVREILMCMPNHVPMSAPALVIGDLHGQFRDLCNLFNTPAVKKFTGDITSGLQCQLVFLGDYVDRGYAGLKVINLLFALLLKYPTKVLLLRGNHECRDISRMYGFYSECQQVYGNIAVWKEINLVFDLMPITAVRLTSGTQHLPS